MQKPKKKPKYSKLKGGRQKHSIKKAVAKGQKANGINPKHNTHNAADKSTATKMQQPKQQQLVYPQSCNQDNQPLKTNLIAVEARTKHTNKSHKEEDPKPVDLPPFLYDLHAILPKQEPHSWVYLDRCTKPRQLIKSTEEE